MSKRNTSIDWLTIKHFWQVSMRYKKDFYTSWLTVISALGLSIAVPYIIGKILASLVLSDTEVTGLIIALVVISIISVITNRISFAALFRLEPKAMAHLHKEVLSSLLSRGSSYLNNRVSGKLVSDATDYPNAYIQLSNAFFIDILPFLLVIVLGIVLVSINSLLIGFVVLVMTVVAIASALHFRRRMTPARLKRHAATKAVTAHIADTIVNNQTVKSFGMEDDELARHQKLSDTLAQTRFQDWYELAKDGSYRIFGLLFFQITFILVVIAQVREDPTLLATGIFAFSYTMTISNRLFQIGIMMRTVEEALLLAMPTTEMLQEKIEIVDAPDAVDLTVKTGSITFKKVSFHYADNPAQGSVFDGINLTVPPGAKIGLVGPSGGGKSTLTRLLLRFEDIQDGQILIDEQDISKVTQHSLHKAIGYVAQDPLLFHRTVRENIAYGNPHATQDEIAEAAEKAYALNFIETLPNGMDTIVGERGVKLSGGQRQRIAIARAILKDAPILVLDEATSALDSESEQLIQKALYELMEGRTTLVIAHRLSTIRHMDSIVVLDKGRIAEKGPHDALVKSNGLYARLWQHQSGGFIQE